MVSSDNRPGGAGSLVKRIKRHVIGREHHFFAAVSPGLETVCQKELEILLPDAGQMAPVEGGVAFTGRLADCYTANLFSRTANRILMRLTDFKATGFHQLDKKLTQLPWELYLTSGCLLSYRITARHSRLYHSGAIKEHVHRAVFHRMAQQGGSVEAATDEAAFQTIFVRVVDDRFYFSLDSSGEHLHKRGIKKHRVKAPIRETLASAALMMAGYDPDQPLFDPMCGSGTFAIEAAMGARRIPAGWFREFAFMKWPAFKPRQWEYIRKKTSASFHTPSRPMVFASDKDEKHTNRLEAWVTKHQFSDTIRVFNADFFDSLPGVFDQTAGLVMINPPYGRRIGIGEDRNAFINRVIQKLSLDFRGWKMGLIVPDKRMARLCPFAVSMHPLFHGGLNLTLLTGRIPG